MIILGFIADMGNQMFQYAAAKTTAMRLGTELLLDLGLYGLTGKSCPYSLGCFNLPEKIAGFKDVVRLFPGRAIAHLGLRPGNKRTILHKIYFRTASYSMCTAGLLPDEEYWRSTRYESLHAPIPLSRVYLQKVQYYTPDFSGIPDNTYMIGNWESEKFWNGMKKEVKSFFQFDAALYNHALLNTIRTTQSVSIHVRRGDKSDNGAFFGSSLDYIKSAAQIIKSKMTPVFFIFSDDIAWCKKYLPPILNTTQFYFVENEGKASAPQDLFLMTQCRHNIAAPSTFSWWGAYLNSNPEKIVIAPHQTLWYKNPKGRQDLLPENWIVLK